MSFTNPYEAALFSLIRSQIVPFAREHGDSEEEISVKALRNMNSLLNDFDQTTAQEQYETAKKILSTSSGA